MAIEGIKSNIMSSVPRTESTVQVESTSTVNTNVSHETGKVVAAQGSGHKNSSEKWTTGKEQEVDIQDVSPEKIQSAIDEINKKIRPTKTQCEFKFHEGTNRISIKVMDKDTNEVIREIPPEKTLDMIAKTLELAGLLVDEKR